MNINYENRIVAFIDVLGFKDLIAESEINNSKIEEIYEVLKYLKTQEKPDRWSLALIEIEEDAQKKGVGSFDISAKIQCSCFSDAIVVSALVSEKSVNEVVSTLIANIAYIGAILMEKGVLIRGGLTIGKLIHTADGIILGQGLIDAYELENKYAKHPRIILSDKLIEKMNYPLLSKSNRYPYHQYVKRYKDGCVGFNQLIYFQVIQSWREITDDWLMGKLKIIREEIVKGLDSSFESPDVHEKYKWLKSEYNSLIILSEGVKRELFEVSENCNGHNIHYSYTNALKCSKEK